MLKIKLIFFILLTMSLGFHVPSDAFAADGDVTSTVEINSSTANFPTLDNGDRLGSSLANIGDLNGDGVNDIASGTYWDDEGGLNRGAVHIMFMNADGSVDSNVVINDSTANGPVLANSDGFGFSVANIGDLDGDGVNDIAAGGIEPTLGGAPAAGEIYIMFMNTDGTPKSTVEIDKTTANGPSGAGGHFGSDIANIGDLNGDGVNDLAVGNYGDTGGGSAHIIFMNTDGTPKSSVEINSSTTNGPTIDDEDRFGRSVENIGDLNGDGVNDLAVGAEYDDMDENGNASGGDNRGAIHIMFMNTDGTPKSTVEINSSTANGPTIGDDDLFGASLANIGDLNGDGVNDIASGTYWDDEGGLNRGAVHIMFMNADGSVDSNVVINDSTANGPVLANSDGFGFSVANIGDLDGDGVNDIAAGGIEPTLGGAPAAGEIYIMFMNTDGTPKSTVEIDKTTANGPSGAGGHFGSDIANIGDLNGDGVNDLAVGNYGDTGGGSAHIIFMNTDGTPKSSVEINSSTTNGPTIDDEDRFGRSVENIGDLNGDGVNDLAVGAEYDDMDENGNASGGDNRGAIHIMFMNTDGTPKSTVEINSSTANGPTIDDDDRLGSSLANIGDSNGDGINDLAVGAHNDDEGGSNRGAIHIMYMVGTLPPTTTTTTTTTSSGGGGKNNCDSNGFGNNNSLRVYQVTYNIKTYEVQVQAYSTCGSVSAKMTTPMQQSILGLSTEQPYLDDMITIYSGFLDESDEKFHISVQNKKQSFTETFYIYDKSITKKYTGSTGYTSEQQGTALPTITSEQITVVSEPSVTQVVQTIEESIPIEEQILDEPLETPQIQSITYTHEPIVEEEIKPQCGVGTKLVDGICKIIKTDEPKFCFLFWCW